MKRLNTRVLAATIMVIMVMFTGCRDSSRTSNGDQQGTSDTAGTVATTPAPTPASEAPTPAVTSKSTDTSTAAPAGGSSGISGEIRQSPLTRGLPEGQQDYGLLAGAAVTVEDMLEKVVATTKSDVNGKFYLDLPSGWYLLIPEPFPDRDYPHPPVSEQVFVPVNGTATVTFTYNSGIK